jgi:GT2 family glycosyltransferase
MFNVSIVLFNHIVAEIELLVQLLRQSELTNELYLIDNSPYNNPDFSKLPATYIFNNGNNIGYGAAHNIAIQKTIEQNIPYHLVINPDISFQTDILSEIVDFMDKNTEIGHLMPKVFYPNGQIQYLCKLLPSPFDLIFRRFLPSGWTRKRRDFFEMRWSGYDKIMDVPYLSGCFMFLRTEALKEVGIFDERFFMYPEDIDLTRRMHRKFRTVFYPVVSIVHHHAQRSYIDIKMLGIHIVNMIRYFNKWGWILDRERTEINKKIIKHYLQNTK